MAVSRPSTIPVWTNGESTQVAAPPPALVSAGWTYGESPDPLNFNWLLWMHGNWFSYIDYVLGQVSTSGSNRQLSYNARLIGGGTWTFALATNTLAWSQAFTIAYPSASASANTVPSGSVTLTDGKAAVVTPNVPYNTTATATSGSTTLTNITALDGIAVGATVTGTGIPASTTVASIGASSVTLSAAATATNTGTYNFIGTAALTVTSVDMTAAPTLNATVLAYRTGSLVYVGIGGASMVLRDMEAKLLCQSGYLNTFSATAGQALTAGQPVYISQGSVDSRTQGSLYPVDASVANATYRSSACGVVVTSVANGATATVLCGGLAPLFSALTPGLPYYADPATPGAIKSSPPTTPGQALVPIGVAVSATSIQLAGVGGSTLVGGGTAWPNYAATNESTLASAIASATALGGVIVISNPITLNTTYTIPNQVTLQGRRGASVLTCAAGGNITLASGAVLAELNFVTTVAQSMVNVMGNLTRINGCRFDMTGASGATGITVSGYANRMTDNHFLNVESPTTVNTGINYASGTNNIDRGSMAVS